MTKTLAMTSRSYSIFLKDGFFDSKDTNFNTKISTYLDLIQIYGFRASQIGMDIKVIDKKLGHEYFADIVVYNNMLNPEIILKVKTPQEYNEFVNLDFTTDLFKLAKFSLKTIKYLVLVYSDNSGYIDQKEMVVIDFVKYKSFEAWKASGYKHTEFIPVI